MKGDLVLSLATVSYTLTLHADKLFMLLSSSADFFQNTIRVSNSLDTDQDQQNGGSKQFANIIGRQ